MEERSPGIWALGGNTSANVHESQTLHSLPLKQALLSASLILELQDAKDPAEIKSNGSSEWRERISIQENLQRVWWPFSTEMKVELPCGSWRLG